MKKKINKKLLARIGAILACVLLVGALVVPCFADAPDYSTEWDENLGALKQNFANSLYAVHNNLSYDYYMELSDIDDVVGILGPEVLVSDAVTTELTRIDMDIRVADGSTFMWTSPDVYVVWSYYNNGRLIRQNAATGELSVFMDTSSHIDLSFGNYSSGDWREYFYFAFAYDDREHATQLVGTTVELRDGTVATFGDEADASQNLYDLDESDVSLTIAFPTSADMVMMSTLAKMLFGDYPAITYPRSEWNWAVNGWERAQRLAEDLIADAYNEDAYQQGYNAAVDDIDSGDFGRNFLGEIFSAPLDALRNFTLVSWTLQNGTDVSISIFTVFTACIGVALFIWFLRLFSGG